MTAYAAGAAGSARTVRLNSNVTRAFVALVVLCLIAGLAFLAGERHASRTTVLTGIPFIGQNEATITVRGWSYGIVGDVTWFDSQGTQHQGSWPSCLRNPGRGVPITFGAVPVTAPDGNSWRQVVWVDCQR
jgi:hypothetical protein